MRLFEIRKTWWADANDVIMISTITNSDIDGTPYDTISIRMRNGELVIGATAWTDEQVMEVIGRWQKAHAALVLNGAFR